jgi:hypothetical protein
VKLEFSLGHVYWPKSGALISLHAMTRKAMNGQDPIISKESAIRPARADYAEWAKDTLGFDLDANLTMLGYQQNAKNALSEIDLHAFTADFAKFARICATEYKEQFRTDLFMSSPGSNTDTLLLWGIKPYNSFIDKCYRINVIENQKFPDPPDDGWVTPRTCYSRFHDIVRCRLVCKYIDGLKFISDRLPKHAEESKVEMGGYNFQRDSGYYAFHKHIKFVVPVLHQSPSDFEDVEFKAEVQITTQLQEILNDLAHVDYEDVRLLQVDDQDSWKWDYESDRFKASYMGHMLHGLEVFIVELRNKRLNSDHNKQK